MLNLRLRLRLRLKQRFKRNLIYLNSEGLRMMKKERNNNHNDKRPMKVT
jgi:hypothetical protein